MTINCRQLSIIIFFLLSSLKFLALPSLIYLECQTDSWLVFVFMIAIDIFLVWIVLSFLIKSKEKNFYEFLKNRIGVFFAKTVCVLFLAVFIIDLLEGITGVQRILVENLYTEFPWYAYLIPLVAILSYIVYKGLRNLGRLCEIFVWLAVFGSLFIVLKGLPGFDVTFFMPMLSNGIGPVFQSLFKHISWFGTPIALLFMMGNIDFRSYKKSTIIKYIVLSSVMILVTVIVFYGVFKNIAGLHSFALPDLSQISNSSTALDEFSWLVVSIWILAQILQLTIFYYSAVHAFKYVFDVKNRWIPSIVINIVIIIYQTISNETVDIKRFFYSNTLVVAELIIKLGVVFIIAIINIIYMKRKRGKSNAKT